MQALPVSHRVMLRLPFKNRCRAAGMSILVAATVAARDLTVPWSLPTSVGAWSTLPAEGGDTLLVGEYYRNPTFVGPLSLPPLSPPASASVCLARIGPDWQPRWLRAMAATDLDGMIWPSRSALDADGNIVFVGCLQGSVTLGGALLTSGGAHYDPLVVKMDQTGAVRWAKVLASDADAGQVALDGQGNLYVAGEFQTLDVGWDHGQRVLAGNRVLAGQCHRRFPGETVGRWPTALAAGRGHPSSRTRPGPLAVSESGHVYASGVGPHGAEFGSLRLSAQGASDAFVVRYSPDGEPEWRDGDVADRRSQPQCVASFRQVLFAANVTADGVCRSLMPLGTFEANQFISGQSGARTPAVFADGSVRLAGTAWGGPLDLGGQSLSGPFLARIDLPLLAPSLDISRQGELVTLSWPGNARGFRLESAARPGRDADWRDPDPIPELIAGRNVVSLPATNAAAFFRLRQP